MLATRFKNDIRNTGIKFQLSPLKWLWIETININLKIISRFVILAHIKIQNYIVFYNILFANVY